jgi:hypothetical protein
MATYIVHYKRAGKYRGFRRLLEAKSMKHLEEPMKADLEGLVPGIEQAEITISDDANEDGSFSGQINYGLLGEFTVSQG